jgi:hypothetical protein
MNFEAFISFNKMGMPLRALEFFSVYRSDSSVAFSVKKLEEIYYSLDKTKADAALLAHQWSFLVESLDEHIGAITSEVDFTELESCSGEALSYEELKNKGSYEVFLETICIRYIEGLLDNYELKENENFAEGFGKIFCKRLLISRDFFYPKK